MTDALGAGHAADGETTEASKESQRGGSGLASAVSACVINHEGERYLPKTLRSLEEHGPPIAEILLVDNASTDASVALVRKDHPSVRVIELSDNRGPGAARNVGLTEARHDRILFIDNDVSLIPGCAARLVQELAGRPRAAAAMPRVLLASDPGTIQYDGADSHFLGLMSLRHAGWTLEGAPERTDTIGSLVTACFLFDRSRWPGGPAFDESFLIYLEDHDFALRLRSAAREIVSVPSARCLHREGTANLSLRATGRYSPVRVECLIRNRWQILLKNYEASTLFRLAPLLLLFEALQLAGAIKKGWLAEWLRSAAWLLRHLRQVSDKRRDVRRRRAVADRDLLCGGPVPFADPLLQGRTERAARRALDSIGDVYWRMLGW